MGLRSQEKLVESDEQATGQLEEAVTMLREDDSGRSQGDRRDSKASLSREDVHDILQGMQDSRIDTGCRLHSERRSDAHPCGHRSVSEV